MEFVLLLSNLVENCDSLFPYDFLFGKGIHVLCLFHHCVLKVDTFLSGFTGSQLENVASRGIMGLFHPPFRYLGEISDLVLLESLRFWAVGIKCIYFSCEKDVNLGGQRAECYGTEFFSPKFTR